MSYRDEGDALRARIEELESKLASANETEMAQQLNKAVREMKNLKRELSHALDARDRAIEDHRKLAAKRSRGPLIPPGAFQRSAVFGAALAATFAAIGGVVLLVGVIADGCSHPLHAGFVVERVHYDAYTEYGENCTGTGSNRSCTPTSTHHPERWTIVVANGEQEVEDALPADEWQRTANGQWYCVLPPCAPAPGPHDFDEVERR